MPTSSGRRPAGKKNADPEEPDPLWGALQLLFYFEGGAPGEAIVGHRVPFGETPAEFPWLFPELEGDEPEFDEPEPGEDPGLEAEAPVVPAVPGAGHRELGLVPGVF